jgi:hypothetical protein
MLQPKVTSAVTSRRYSTIEASPQDRPPTETGQDETAGGQQGNRGIAACAGQTAARSVTTTAVSGRSKSGCDGR